MAWYSNFMGLIAQAAPAAAAAADQVPVAVPGSEALSGTMQLIIAAAILVGSFVGGAVIARALRVPEQGFRMGLVLFSLIASAAICYFGWPPKRGIDLSGGVVLIYEVDTGLAKSEFMPTAIQRINTQLNAEGGEKLEARPEGNNQIEVAVPDGVDLKKVEQKVDALRDSADLSLNLESRKRDGNKTVLVYRVDASSQKNLDMNKLIGAVSKRINPGGVKELTIRQYGAEQLEVIVPEVEDREVDQIKKKISTSGNLQFRIVANDIDDKDVIKAAQRTSAADVYIGGRRVGRWVKAGPELPQTLPPPMATYRNNNSEILVRIDPFNVDGRYLTRATPDTDERGGRAVAFMFDSLGSEKFGQLTSRNLPDTATDFHRHLGIVLDDVMTSAPRIITTIRGRGQITGGFSEDYVNLLVDVLNAGSLPASLRPDPISQQKISAQVGDDTIKAGANAMLISTAAILLFMLVYYRFAGIVADVAVLLNVLITVALMIVVKAAFTLPGLAGLVLTLGMAVDANVLIYERIREESARGASLRMAIRNGFSKATATIIDSNLTTLITAIVLYIIGTDQVKGFAVTLILGLLVSMFTAIIVSRLILDIFEKNRWITKLRMMQIVGATNIDFVRWCIPTAIASLALIAIGLVAATGRGKGILDIDFTGGSSVQLVFAEDQPQNIADVRERVSQLDDVAVSSLGEKGVEFKIDTSNRDIRKVQAELTDTFAGKLRTYAMTYGDLALIEAPANTKPADKPADTGPAMDIKPAEPAPEAKPAEETKPAEEPQPETKPAAEPKPEETKPAEQPKAEEAKPAEPAPAAPQSSVGRRRTIEVASTSTELALAALQDPPADAPAAAEQKPATPEEKPTAPVEEKPVGEPAAETPATDKPAEAKPAGETQAAQTPVTDPGAMIGGTRVELTFPQEISHDPLRELIQAELDKAELRDAAFRLVNPDYESGSDRRFVKWTLETTLAPDQTRTLLDAIQKELASTPVFPSSSEIGGKVAGDTQLMALYAMIASMVMIVLYVWIRFQNLYFGIAAVVALIHDVLVAAAFLALSAYLSPYMQELLVDPFKISLSVVAALLTIVGFSINDTIVIFDRIREVRGKSPELTRDMINLSVNQTLSRTILTSGTVLITSVILYAFGGPGIHAFAYTMVIGVIAGTYSSVYIAAPILLWMTKPKPASGANASVPVSAGSR